MIAELPLIPGNAREKSVAFQKTYEKYLESVGEAKGVQVLANFTHGPGMANTVKKVTSYKELEGVKMRVGGGVANAIGTALGIAGVNAPAPKVYEIISGGVADGVMFPFETMHAFKIAELAKYSLHNPDGMYTTAFAVIMNNDSYNDLSAAHKKCIDEKYIRISTGFDFIDASSIKGVKDDVADIIMNLKIEKKLNNTIII